MHYRSVNSKIFTFLHHNKHISKLAAHFSSLFEQCLMTDFYFQMFQYPQILSAFLLPVCFTNTVTLVLNVFCSITFWSIFHHKKLTRTIQKIKMVEIGIKQTNMLLYSNRGKFKKSFSVFQYSFTNSTTPKMYSIELFFV